MAELAFLKEFVPTIASFGREQALTWFQILRDPKSALGRVETVSDPSLLQACGFLVFMYGVVFALRLPAFFVIAEADTTRLMPFMMLFVFNMVSFAIFTAMLHAGLRLVWSKVAMAQTFQFCCYVIMSFWPLTVAGLYIGAGNSAFRASFRGAPVSTSAPGDAAATLVILLVFAGVIAFIVARSTPVLAALAKIGRARAALALIVGLILTFACWNVVLTPLLPPILRAAQAAG